jgi:hypothetical protein
LGSEQDLKNAMNDALVFECGLDVELYVRRQLALSPSSEARLILEAREKKGQT